MNIQRPKGTKDILPKEIHKWHYIEKTIREVTDIYNFKEIRTPTFESTDLFKRGVGTETDIVGKEMYTFTDKGGKSLTLRPEMTAPIARAYLENNMHTENLVNKLYYITNMFRYEKPQEGRYREHTQFGAELLGSDSVDTDVEIINLAKDVFKRIGISEFKLKINSIGKSSERKRYIEKLIEFLNKYKKDISEDSRRRLETNPLRILDSKDKDDRKITDEAPKIEDYLDTDSKVRFENVKLLLNDSGINYEVDYRLVRGIDYYTDTTFEFISEKLGAQDALGGGGRYDGLISQLGGKAIPGIGFGIGVDRMLIVAEKNNFEFPYNEKSLIYIISLNENALGISRNLIKALRQNGIKTDTDYLTRSFKAQMREADKLKSKYVYIIGEDEIKSGEGILRNMNNRQQHNIKFENLKDHLINEN